MAKLVIIGAGHAGGSTAVLLQSHGYAGAVTVVGDEPLAPYQRPPLSKAWLTGPANAEDLLLRPLDFYASSGIALRLGERVVSIELDARTVTIDGGDRIEYDTLVIATGARPRTLPVPGADLPAVLSLRTAGDAEALKAHLRQGARLAVVGGGYVGLEVAASARHLGAEVIVIERESRCLPRVASEPLSRFYQDYHERNGVSFELDADVVSFQGHAAQLRGVGLANGRTVQCEVAVVGVGAVPNDELARAAGLHCPNGVAVNELSQTADAHVYAVGDVACRPIPMYQRTMRLESVANALEQARQAAAHICGREPKEPETPWFWSDQYDLKLQIAGVAIDCDRLVTRGNPATDRFAIFHLRGHRVMAVEAVNSPAEFVAGRRLVQSQQPVSVESLTDLGVPMKDVIAGLALPRE